MACETASLAGVHIGVHLLRVCTTRLLSTAFLQLLKHLDEFVEIGGRRGTTVVPAVGVETHFEIVGNGKLRDECLSATWFLSLSEAQEQLEAFRRDYNETRAHSSLGNLPPAVYVQQLQELRASCS